MSTVELSVPTMYLRFVRDKKRRAVVLQQKWTNSHYDDWRDIPFVDPDDPHMVKEVNNDHST